MSGWLVPPRHPGPELIDSEEPPQEEWRKALREIALVNRWLGGTKPLYRELHRLARALGRRELSLLDVGTGGADIPSSLSARLSRSGIRLRAAGCDLSPGAAAIAQGNGGAEILRADAFHLPFPDSGFDAVTASLFFHHFTEREGSRLLAEFHRVARHVVLVNDLARHRLPWLLIRGLSAAFRASPLFRHDAPLSVLRGFTAAELGGMAREAGLAATARIERCWAFRLLLVAEKSGP